MILLIVTFLTLMLIFLVYAYISVLSIYAATLGLPTTYKHSRFLYYPYLAVLISLLGMLVTIFVLELQAKSNQDLIIYRTELIWDNFEPKERTNFQLSNECCLHYAEISFNTPNQDIDNSSLSKRALIDPLSGNTYSKKLDQ